MVAGNQKIPLKTMNDSNLFTDEPAPANSLFTDEPAPSLSERWKSGTVDLLSKVPGSAWNAASKIEPAEKGVSEAWKSAKENPAYSNSPIGLLEKVPGLMSKGAGKLGEAATEELSSDPNNHVDPVTAASVGTLIGMGPDLMMAGSTPEEPETELPAAKEVPQLPLKNEGNNVFPSMDEIDKALSSNGRSRPNVEPNELTEIPQPENKTHDIISDVGENLPSSITDPMHQVKDYLVKQYGSAAEKEGWGKTLAQYMKRYGQNMSVKNMGASPLQVKQVGPDAARELGKFAIDKGITSPFVGEIGMEEKLNQIHDLSGKQIGAFRKIADARANAPHDINEVLQTITNELDPVYLKGIESSQKGSYLKALEEIKRADPTHEGLAEVATKLNKSATNAARLKQANGAISDVANKISELNNNSVAKHLNPKEMNDYENALREFGATKKIQQFMGRKEAREVAGRLGPGGGIRHMTQQFLDTIGYKLQARIATKLGEVLEKNPEKAKDLPVLFKEFIHQIEDLGTDFHGE